MFREIRETRTRERVNDEKEVSSGYKEIYPVKYIDINEVNKYWDEIFGNKRSEG